MSSESKSELKPLETLDLYRKFHYLFIRKDHVEKAGIMWEELKKSPPEGLASVIQLLENPFCQTLETGFLLGVTLAYAYEKAPASVLNMLNAIDFHEKVRLHGNLS